MPQPTESMVMQDKFLTNLSVAFANKATNFVADQAFPKVMSKNITGKYPTYTAADWARDSAKQVPLGGSAVRSGYDMSTGSYSCEHWGIEKQVPDEIKKNADNPVDPKRDATAWVTEQLLIRRERRFATNYMTGGSSTWDNELDVNGSSTKWDVDVGSDPIEEIKDAKLVVLKAIGRMPNCIVAGVEVIEALRKHPDIVERYKYTDGGAVPLSGLAQLFGVEKILVSEAVYETADEDVTSSRSFIVGQSLLLCFSPSSPSLLTPAAGYTIVFNGMGNPRGLSIDQYREERSRSDIVRGAMFDDLVKISSAAGYLFYNCVTAS